MEPIAATLVPLALFTMITVVCCAGVWLVYKTRQDSHETIRKALELGQPLDPEILRSLGRQQIEPEADLRGGVIAGCIGLAFLLMAGANAATGGDHDGSRVASFVGIIALGLGIGRVIAWKLRAGSKA